MNDDYLGSEQRPMYCMLMGGGAATEAFPVGSVFVSVVSTNPSSLLGYGTWQAIGQGRAVVGVDVADPDFDVAEKLSGTKMVVSAGTVSTPTFTGTPVSSVINHTHTVNVNDPGHTHTQVAHTHTLPVGATDDTASPFDRADAGTNTGGANSTTSVGSTTPTINTGTTGVTATTANPVGGVSSITPAGTLSTPTFTGSPTSVVQPSIALYLWKRTV